MHEPNFFQSKLALAKAFPGRKLPMTKLHQLYRDIYSSKPKRKILSMMRDESKIGVFHGEVSIYAHKDMDKLIDKYIDFDGDMQYYAEALLGTESPALPEKKKNVTIKTRIRESSSVPPPQFDQNFTLTKFNLQKPTDSEKGLSNNASYRTQSSVNNLGKSPIPESTSQKKIPAKKWPREIQALHESIEKHSNHKSHRRLLKSSQGEETPIKEDHPDINSQLRTYLHRLGLDHRKTATEEAKDLAKRSNRTNSHENTSIHETPTMVIKDEKHHLRESNTFDKLERNMSIFSKERKPQGSETTSIDQAAERHFSVFSKVRRGKRASNIPSLEIPPYGNSTDKIKLDKSALLPETSQVIQKPSVSLNNSQSFAGTPLHNHVAPSPLLFQTHSPAVSQTAFFLPKMNRTQKAASISLSKPVRIFTEEN